MPAVILDIAVYNKAVLIRPMCNYKAQLHFDPTDNPDSYVHDVLVTPCDLIYKTYDFQHWCVSYTRNSQSLQVKSRSLSL